MGYPDVSLEKSRHFGKAIEAPGPRVAYAEGLARAVLCEVRSCVEWDMM